MRPIPPVHFTGIVIGPSGFAGEGRQFLAAIEAAGMQPSLSGYSLGSNACSLPAEEAQLIQRCAARTKQPGGITVHHNLIPHFEPDPQAAVNVLITVFEAEGLPPGWACSANRADSVIVLTDFNRRTFSDAGVDAARLTVIPPPFPAARFRPRTSRRGASPFRWLSVFDWQQRKGPDVLLSAFGRTFAEGEAELTLKLMSDARFSQSQIQAYCARVVGESARGRPPKIRVIDTTMDLEKLIDCYREADGFVLASRGEGWGRPVHEAMLMELPVVASHGSSLQTLLPDASVGYPVRCSRQAVSEIAAMETPVFSGLDWHEPDAQHLQLSMREVVDDPISAQRRASRGRQHVLSLCDPQRITAMLSHHLENLSHPARPA